MNYDVCPSSPELHTRIAQRSCRRRGQLQENRLESDLQERVAIVMVVCGFWDLKVKI